MGVRRIVWHSIHRPELMRQLRNKGFKLENDRNTLKPWTAAQWTGFEARHTLAQLRGVKWFPQTYVERAEVDPRLAAALQSDGPRAVLILGDAGLGKSSLIAKLVDGLLSGKGEDDTVDAVIRTGPLPFRP